MVLETAKANQLMTGLSDHPNHMVGEMDKIAAEVKALLVRHGKLDMPCGIDIANYNLIAAFRRADIKLSDGNVAICDAQMVKTQDEIHCLQMAAVIGDAAHSEVARALRPGMTEFEIAGIAANACYKYGAEELEGPSFVVCTGERSGHGVPNMPTDRRVRPGDLVVIDINGVGFNGYRTCYYRTYCVGDKPTDFQKEVYKVALDGVTALAACIKPGITTEDVQREWLKLGDFPGGWGRKTKWPEPGRHFFGTVGHSIGLRSGDPGPTIPGTTAHLGYGFPAVKLQKNMTFAVECGCFTWLGDRWAKDGVKIENVGVVTDKGFEIFYRAPSKELIACGLPGVY
jgi:Xaa-Pro dipeptidase